RAWSAARLWVSAWAALSPRTRPAPPPHTRPASGAGHDSQVHAHPWCREDSARSSPSLTLFRARSCRQKQRLLPCRMLAMRPRFLTGLALALLISGVFGCESSPMDMWISRDPDAGSDFDAPMREVRPTDATGEGTGGAG